MARPVMPDDQEFEYLPTQAVADFLATGAVGSLDGIIFPSVQADGDIQNVVLFHDASLVEVWDVPSDVEIDVRMTSEDEDGSYPDFTTFWWRKENTNEAAAASETGDNLWDLSNGSISLPDRPRRPNTLRIDPGGVEVRKIEAVQFVSSDFQVDHRQMPAHGHDF